MFVDTETTRNTKCWRQAIKLPVDGKGCISRFARTARNLGATAYKINGKENLQAGRVLPDPGRGERRRSKSTARGQALYARSQSRAWERCRAFVKGFTCRTNNNRNASRSLMRNARESGSKDFG